MDLSNKNSRFGIWGFGATGKSAASYLIAQGYPIQIMDHRTPSEKEWQFFQEKNIRWYTQAEMDSFFISSDFIIASPGINIKQFDYATHKDKFITELDFFSQNFQKPIIAITGSVGKTSITYMLDKIFSQLSISVATGGNIGIPTFDLIPEEHCVDYALLEVSSFQLMDCRHFAPYLAIWTNFYPNHLDYHETEDEYFQAKYAVLKYQHTHSLSLVPFALREKLPRPATHHVRSYFTIDHIEQIDIHSLTNNEQIYYIENNWILRYANTIHTPIIHITTELADLSFIENILILASVCDIMKLDSSVLQSIALTTGLPEHRIENIGTAGGVAFYNDSKATTTASTLAAIEKLKNSPLHLFLGGLSKGVDRSSFIAQLKNNIQHVYCFGAEAEQLYRICINTDIPATYYDNLDKAFTACTDNIIADDCVLFSPAGSSYDLYTNYEERGKHFKKLFRRYLQTLP